MAGGELSLSKVRIFTIVKADHQQGPLQIGVQLRGCIQPGLDRSNYCWVSRHINAIRPSQPIDQGQLPHAGQMLKARAADQLEPAALFEGLNSRVDRNSGMVGRSPAANVLNPVGF